MSTYLYLMGWNEILARIFDGFEVQRNIAPDWLVNPATRRKLKLDLLYPEIGIAVRYVGLQGKRRGRKSDWEELEAASRDEIRQELCRLNGVDLILLTPYDAYPREQLKQINRALSAASRRIAKQGRFRGKAALMEQLARSRTTLDSIRRNVNNLDDLAPYAELWRDREANIVSAVQGSRESANGSSKRKTAVRNYKVGQRVKHQRFGAGEVMRVDRRDGDVYITVNFVTAGERQLMASLVADKMTVIR